MKIIKICEEFHPNYGVQCIERAVLVWEKTADTLEDAHQYIIQDIHDYIKNCEDIDDDEVEEYAEELEITYPDNDDNMYWAQLVDHDMGNKLVYVITV